MARKKSVNHRWLHLIWATPVCIIALVAGLYFLPEPEFTDGFRTLDEIKAYADTLDEWVEMDNDRIFIPCYNKYYEKKFATSFRTKMTQKIKLLFNKQDFSVTSKPSLNFFKQLLNEVTTTRINKNLTGNFIQKIEHIPNAQLVVFGPLYGAFHSFTRDLNQLMQLKIIDNNLKILNKTTTIILLGNAITKSPFCLETFLLVLQLMHKNPNQVIYVKGHQEISDQWKAQSLYRELALAFPGNKHFSSRLEKEVDAFFDTLPLAAYYTFNENNETHYLKFAYSGIKTEILSFDDKNLSEDLRNFLTIQQKKHISTYQLTESPIRNFDIVQQPLHIQAIISGILKRNDVHDTNGLTLLTPMHGIIRWRISSAPTSRSREIFECFNDAFIIIHPKNWQIELHYRDTREKYKEFNVKSYHLFSGEEITQK